MRMNKKGTVLWWAIFLFIVGVAVFLVRISQSTGLEVKGDWQMSFLENNYLEAEKELLMIDSVTKNIGIDIARTMAKNAGFVANSPCGKYLNTNLLIKDGKWCLPNIKDGFETLAKSKLNKKLSKYGYKNATYTGNYFYAIGEKKNISSKEGIYYFNTDFSVNLGYSFDDYMLLFEETKRIFSLCSLPEDLKVCLDKNKRDYWNYGACESPIDIIVPGEKQVAFCVQSPNLYTLPEGDGFVRTFSSVYYSLAIDFSPTAEIVN